MQAIMDLYKKNREIVVYLIVGVTTTLINIFVFMALSFVNIEVVIANTIAFVVAVIFAYWANAKIVFQVKQTVSSTMQFLCMRLITLLFDNYAMVWLLSFGVGKLIAKIAVNIVIIIFNYILSKFVIFRKKEKERV